MNMVVTEYGIKYRKHREQKHTQFGWWLFVKRLFFERNCNESGSWNTWVKGECNCSEQLRLMAEFKRDIVHEIFLDPIIGVGT